jgi:hypothetical protein
LLEYVEDGPFFVRPLLIFASKLIEIYTHFGAIHFSRVGAIHFPHAKE